MKLSISGTAVNGGKARTLIQRRDLARFGFCIGSSYDVHFGNAAITLIAKSNGARKVARVTDKRRGHDYATIDLRYPIEERERLFNGAERLSVTVECDKILIQAE